MGYQKGPGRAYATAYTSSITNRWNCGGNKKAGLPPKIGVPINILVNNKYQSDTPPCCKVGGPCGYGVKNRSVQRVTMIY
jgi:hypothetical protein